MGQGLGKLLDRKALEMTPEEKGAVAAVIIASVFVGMVVGFFAGYIIATSQPQPVPLETVNRLMANRPCGYPNLTYDDPYGNMCCITEDQWYALNGNTWVRMGLPR